MGSLDTSEWSFNLLGRAAATGAVVPFSALRRRLKWRPKPVVWPLQLQCATICVCVFALLVIVAVVYIFLEVDNSAAGWPSRPPPLPNPPPPSTPTPPALPPPALPPPPGAPASGRRLLERLVPRLRVHGDSA